MSFFLSPSCYRISLDFSIELLAKKQQENHEKNLQNYLISIYVLFHLLKGTKLGTKLAKNGPVLPQKKRYT